MTFVGQQRRVWGAWGIVAGAAAGYAASVRFFGFIYSFRSSLTVSPQASVTRQFDKFSRVWVSPPPPVIEQVVIIIFYFAASQPWLTPLGRRTFRHG